MPLDAGTQLGRYEIRSLLGAGGMGEVYLAHDSQLQRLIALKVLYAEATLDSDRIDRFVQEAKAASALNHPNILTIYEIGQIDDLHFICTEYVEGETLRERMMAGPTEPASVINLAIEIASALAAAHRAGIVHRDIKPENVMLRDDGYVKVLDFGLAKLYESQIHNSAPEAMTVQLPKTEPGMIMGTIPYMSPEQARGQDVDARSDIWSLGVLLYEMVSRKVPFDGITSVDVLAAILKTEPQPLKDFAPKTPAELQRIVKKALRKQREERYQTIQEMLLDLKALSRELEVEKPESDLDDENPSSIAILPFRNLTNDSAVSFYEFSLADAVITELVRLRSLIVSPSSVVARYLDQTKDPLEIGKELKVNAVLAANFIFSKDRIRVTTQLIDVVKGRVLWAERIDEAADDIITVQDTITQRIVDGLQLKFSSNERIALADRVSINPTAYGEYLRGRDLFNKYVHKTVAYEDIEKAMAHLATAIELEPKFALAHCALGSCYLNLVNKGFGVFEDIERARKALDDGLRLDPEIIEARADRSYIYLLQGEKQKAYREIDDLRHAQPNNSRVHFYSNILYRLSGDYESALHSLDEALRLDPTARVFVGYARARIYLYQERYKDAILELEHAMAAEPKHPTARFYLAVSVFRSGDAIKAAVLLRELLATDARDAFRPHLAMCLSTIGNHTEALEQLTDGVERVAMTDPDVAYWLASAYLMENQHDEALRWLEYAIKIGNENLPWLRRNPIWKPVFDDPRFVSLMHQIEYGRRNMLNG
jgi:serine/threonine protein kinase/Flp pilus assembly protein TadD